MFTCSRASQNIESFLDRFRHSRGRKLKLQPSPANCSSSNLLIVCPSVAPARPKIMALKVPSSSSYGRLETLWREVFYCPACSTWRKSRPTTITTSRRVNWSRRRQQSTLVSSTAVNATKKIPPKYKELHDALQALQKKAPAHINQSRLQLALSGLESERPVTRIASEFIRLPFAFVESLTCIIVLGVNRSATAKQVVRFLLADALQKEADWERQLDTVTAEGEEDTGGIIIR